MDVPLTVSLQDVPNREAIESLIRDRVDKLEQFYPHLIGCDVAVEKPNKAQSHGNPWRVRVNLSVPNKPVLAVKTEPSKGDLHTDLETQIRNVFDSAERRLEGTKEMQRRDVKRHEQQETKGIVVEKNEEGGYGFIRDIDGRSIYFHRNSVLNDDFESVKIGAGVNYAEELGNEGPQATTVRVIENPERL